MVRSAPRAAGGRHVSQRHDRVIRSRYYDESHLDGAPAIFPAEPLSAVGVPDTRCTLQVYVEDCTGCALCVEGLVVMPRGTEYERKMLVEQVELGTRREEGVRQGIERFRGRERISRCQLTRLQGCGHECRQT
jgi:hypothetical protein